MDLVARPAVGATVGLHWLQKRLAEAKAAEAKAKAERARADRERERQVREQREQRLKQEQKAAERSRVSKVKAPKPTASEVRYFTLQTLPSSLPQRVEGYQHPLFVAHFC